MQIQRSEVEEMEQLLMKAIKERDIDFINKYIHDDLLCLAPNGQIITKEMDLSSHKSGDMVVQSLISTQEDVRIIDDTAISTIVYDTKGIMLGRPIEGKFRYIRVWKKFGDDLKVIAAGCCKL
ncbi:MAG TPA: nuclear transport factor 2 family protein [Cytophagaceae bacterium]